MQSTDLSDYEIATELAEEALLQIDSGKYDQCLTLFTQSLCLLKSLNPPLQELLHPWCIEASQRLQDSKQEKLADAFLALSKGQFDYSRCSDGRLPQIKLPSEHHLSHQMEWGACRLLQPTTNTVAAVSKKTIDLLWEAVVTAEQKFGVESLAVAEELEHYAKALRAEGRVLEAVHTERRAASIRKVSTLAEKTIDYPHLWHKSSHLIVEGLEDILRKYRSYFEELLLTDLRLRNFDNPRQLLASATVSFGYFVCELNSKASDEQLKILRDLARHFWLDSSVENWKVPDIRSYLKENFAGDKSFELADELIAAMKELQPKPTIFKQVRDLWLLVAETMLRLDGEATEAEQIFVQQFTELCSFSKTVGLPAQSRQQARNTKSFIEELNQILDEITFAIEDRLWQYWTAGDAVPDAPSYVYSDITGIATFLHFKKNNLSRKQYMFLVNLSLAGLSDPSELESNIQIISDLARDKAWREPKIFVLSLLRDYDAIFATDYTAIYRDFLLSVVSHTLMSIASPTDSDCKLVDQCDEVWSEICTASRRLEKLRNQESRLLIQAINESISQFVKPIAAVVNARSELSSLKNPDSMLRRSLAYYFEQAIVVDCKVDIKELDLFYDLAPTLGRFGSENNIEKIRADLREVVWELDTTELPLPVMILDMYDEAMDTNLGELARTIYFRLVNSVFKADMSISAEELETLQQFKETLYPDSSSIDNESIFEQSKRESKVTPKTIMVSSTVEESLEELNSLIGLERVKQDFSQLVNFIKVQQMRVERGLPASAVTKHIVFYGNPGTGKTTVARILANIYKALGILSSGHLIEVDRPRLVAGFVGQTAIKVSEVVSSALGGILFIDEAYSLVPEGNQDTFGQEAIDTLVKAMEDHREDLVVIVAGYPERMERFIKANPGLKSRFNKFFHFEDYSPEQMLAISELFCKRAAFSMNDSALKLVRTSFEQIHAVREEDFGNARDVRNIFENIIGNQANRIISLPEVNDEILSTITEEDVLPILASLRIPITESEP